MDFIKRNWWRLFTRALPTFLFLELIFGITYWADSRSGKSSGSAPELLLLYPGCLAMIFSCLAFYIALLRFYTARKLYEDDSDTSLKSLFDYGSHRIVPESSGFITPTREYLAGYISSYPVIIIYAQNKRSKYKPMIHMGAIVIDQGRESMPLKSFEVSVSFKGKLKHGLHDQVTSFIDTLKQSGATPNPNPDYDNRNKYLNNGK